MKLNWGSALLIFFVVYIGVLVYVVFKSRTIDHSLVVEDYYQHDIRYQEKLDKQNNRQFLQKDLSIRFVNKEQLIRLDFGNSKAEKAKVELYKPDNKSRDIKKEYNVPENGILDIKTNEILPGRWTVKVDWKDAQRAYYKEESVYVSRQ